MPKLTIVFGVLLISLGMGGFWGSGFHAPTSLIPSAVGGVLVIAGAIAQSNPGARMHAMHAAVTIGLLGFLAAAIRIGMTAAKGTFGRDGLATFCIVTMAVLTGLFVVLCVRSFIAARKARVAAT